MKVALVCDWFHPRVGGIELHLRDLAHRLVAAGQEVVVVTPTQGNACVDGIRVVRIPGKRAPHFDFLIAPSGVQAIGEALARERVDVAHCHVSIVSPAALGGAAQAQRRHLPTVLTFHSIVPQTRLLAAAVRAGLRTDRWASRFSAVSRIVAHDVQPIAPAQPMSILANGVDAAFWRSGGRARERGALELLSVMRLNAKKRPLALVEMMRRVIAAVPEQRVRLRVVGDGPERAKVERAITGHGLADHIQLLGRRTREGIRDLLSDSDIFVLPAIRESFGLAALEARCAGLPVVAMGMSGVAEWIAHGQEGLLAGSDAELAAHITTLARDDALRRRIAGHNRATTPSCDWPAVIDAHLAIYREAIALRDNVRVDIMR